MYSIPAQASSSGDLGPESIGIYTGGEYDIWVDRGEKNRVLDTEMEPVDTIGSSFGFKVESILLIPKVPVGTITSVLLSLAAVVLSKKRTLIKIRG